MPSAGIVPKAIGPASVGRVFCGLPRQHRHGRPAAVDPVRIVLGDRPIGAQVVGRGDARTGRLGGMDRQTEFVLRTIEDRNIKFIRLWFTDVAILRGLADEPSSEGRTYFSSNSEAYSAVRYNNPTSQDY